MAKTAQKRDIYSEVTQKLVTMIEKGTAPWQIPWKSGPCLAVPVRVNGAPYQGINVVLLWIEAQEKGYRSNRWMTYNQAKALKGQVRMGEKGTLVVYANKFKKTVENDSGESKDIMIPFLKGFMVFNVDQIDNLPAKYQVPSEGPELTEAQRIETAEKFFAEIGADIRHGGSKAFYVISQDYIQLPAFKDFSEPQAYYATMGHETIHWTRHESRLNRDMGRKKWGDAGYAMEELVAEIGAAFLCAQLGITVEPREDHAAYVKNWLEVLNNDSKAIFTAASEAQKACNFLFELGGIMPKADEVGGDEESDDMALAA